MLDTFQPHTDSETIVLSSRCTCCRKEIRVILPEIRFFASLICLKAGATLTEAFPYLTPSQLTTLTDRVCPPCQTSRN